MLGHRILVVTAGCALFASPFAFPAIGAQKFDVITKKEPDAKTTIWRIDQPDIRLRMKEYPQIRFQPGDQVLIHAGGCCQTGGRGRTWKRYVDPIGENTDRLYHGLVSVDTAESGSLVSHRRWYGSRA